ncbi:MAG: MFS transporter [Candidatus Thorarchaeota archaeon]
MTIPDPSATQEVLDEVTEAVVKRSRVARLFGFKEPTESGLRMAKILALLIPVFSLSFQISTTFYMIYIAETLGGGDYIAGLALVGVLVVIQLGTQTALDYPTGALGDWIGQRYVIASAMVTYGIAFGLTSTITSTTPFFVFAIIYALFGFGGSQESGAFNAWFDNNYRVAMPHDKDRKQYGVFMGKLGMIGQLTATLVLIPGSWLALVFSRTWVFSVQAVLCMLLAVLVMILIKDLPGVREKSDEKPSTGEYKSLLKDGVKFLYSSKFIIYITLGEILMFSTGPVWWNLLLFPLYFSYLITDVAVSSYRTLIFIPAAGFQERTGVWSQRFEPKKWIPRFRLVQFNGFVMFLLLALITFTFAPPPETAEMARVLIPFTNLAIIEVPVVALLPVALMFTTFVVCGIFGGLAGILTQRIMIDVVPNRIRNSMYSLRPTLILLVSIPLIMFFGWAIPAFGFPFTFIVCSIITLVGALSVWKAFSHPIPRADMVKPATEEESEEVEVLEVT